MMKKIVFSLSFGWNIFIPRSIRIALIFVMGVSDNCRSTHKQEFTYLWRHKGEEINWVIGNVSCLSACKTRDRLSEGNIVSIFSSGGIETFSIKSTILWWHFTHDCLLLILYFHIKTQGN